MKIRSLLFGSALLTAVVAIGLGIGVVIVTRAADAALDEQYASQQVARDVANMLALTNELIVYGSERAATQWRVRQEQLVSGVERAMTHRDPPLPALIELRGAIDDLPGLFETLVQVSQAAPSPLGQRRRELMLERLLIETQEVIEARYRWAVAIGEQQRKDQRLYTAMVLGAPAALMALLVALGALVARRVLRPLARLESAATEIRGGDLSARCASASRDELGDVARAVDSMAQALQRQSAALRESGQQLRLVTDSLPALVARIDADERYTFVNAHVGRIFGIDPQQMLGKTMREVCGEKTYQDIAPRVARALAGETVNFESEGYAQGQLDHYQSIYVPDREDGGRVRGFFAMTFDITARKEAELRQKASEQRLIDITDNLPALVAYLDHDHCYRFANANYGRWLGVDQGAMMGRSVSQVLGAATYAAVRPNIERALAGERALTGERVQWSGQGHRDGRSVYYLAEYIPDIAPDGSVRGCYALTMDITQRHEAELELARSQQRLTDLTNSLPAMVAYFDMSERCQYANDTALRSQGLERSDVPGVSLRTALGESNYAQHEPYVKEALQGRRSRLQGRIPFDGRDAHFQAHLIPDRIEGGKQRGFYLMTFDITALKEAQQQQARVERQMRAITNNLPVLIAYIDSEERYAFVNATYGEWLGLDTQSVLGRNVADVTPPEFYEPRRAAIQQALGGQRTALDTRALLRGINRHLQSVYIPDIQSDGQVLGIYALSTDVTRTKEIEARLSEMAHVDPLTGLPNRRQLEERLKEATARASRAGKPIALMFLDVDHFKSINDHFGHAAGDTVLKEFGTRLRACVRITDTAARLAGDEFVVLVEGLAGPQDANVVAEKIVTAMREPFRIDAMEMPVSTSIGVAFCESPSADSDLMGCADAALYDAKHAGRNTFRLRSLASPITGFVPDEAAASQPGHPGKSPA